MMGFLAIAFSHMLQWWNFKILFRKLKHTDEEVEQSFEDFYEDVHTEFLKFGELVNFKVCKNGSSHLRGNVYVHYKSLESAMLAYQSTNGRYFAGKLLTCEFINVTRWRVAICGEYMKSRLKNCSRGSACNFIHCFQNPGGDYEWADWDKPAPRYWVKKMAALFGYTSDGLTDEVSLRYHSRRSRSRGLDSPHRKSFSDEEDGQRRRHGRHSPHRGDGRETRNLDREMHEEKRTYQQYQDYHCFKLREIDNVNVSEGSTDGQRSVADIKRSSKKRERERESTEQGNKSRKVEAISSKDESAEGGASDRYLEHRSRSLIRQKSVALAESVHECRHKKVDKSDHGKSPYADKYHDKSHRYKDQRVTQKKNEADPSNFDSHGHIQDSEEDGHHSRSEKNLRRVKGEAESSSSDSDDSRCVKAEKRQQQKRRKSSRSKNMTGAEEIRCDGDSLESYEHKQHRHREKSPREVKNISESADGRGRLDRDDKRPQKTVRKSSRLKNRSGFTDTKSDRDDNRHHRHSSSSDSAFAGDRVDRCEKRSQKSRRMRSRFKKELDLIDTKSDEERIDEEERHCGHLRTAKHQIKEPGLSKVEAGKADACNFVTDDRCRSSHAYLDPNHQPEQENTKHRYCGTRNQTVRSYVMNPDVQGESLCRFSDGDKCHYSSFRDLASERDHERCDEEHMLQVNRSDEEATGFGKVVTSFVHTSCEGIDDEAKAELEKACRHAALKKLEKIRMHKETQAISREPIESLKNCTQESILSSVLEKADSSKVETSDASTKRRRI